MIPVSVVVMTRNEAVNLPHCLSALGSFAERFVVDSGSTDGTPAIAEAAGARVVPFRWDGRYPKKKQWCLDQLSFRQDWVLFVDADERLGGALVEEITALMTAGPRHSGYFVDGHPVFLGRRLRFGARNRKLMLFDRRKAHFPTVPDLDVATMWEVEGHYQPVIAGTVGRLRHSLTHSDDKPIAAWFDRHARYADWEAALRSDGRMADLIQRESGARRWLKAWFGVVPARPLLVFLYGYVWRLGFLDGGPGFQHALARAFYYWQIGLKIADARRRAGPPASTDD
ncbi:glycosyl transferase [Azospirillum baldaniorum]|uniref:Lipopolysaccharide core biosynthesis glycosyltransferase n=1 Tax=Azospirillum baldaniorum TaxID=1064539 RepID=A0A9P1NLW7_9PROT|nr:glycosyltransferase family 2 protein [Azospirillum baldaniorum]AWJ89905.1 glycosyl transferase [Azospirillum baldaniorum]TWA75411.1 glycosyltransferase involved in cell wall biosynthesis [Azospirillum brasilense]CCC98077.1 putative Lipopolysaccharide core biosynthesis glycosyltransferase [Azospirillum baldaniorum]